MDADSANALELLLICCLEEPGLPKQGWVTMGALLLVRYCRGTGKTCISLQESGDRAELEAKLADKTSLVHLCLGEDCLRRVEVAISVVIGSSGVSTRGLRPDVCCFSTAFLAANGLPVSGWVS
jgi:hypothetical protein